MTLEEIYRLRADGSRPAVPLKPSFSKKTGRADKNITFSKVKKPARGNKNKYLLIFFYFPFSFVWLFVDSLFVSFVM